jgi:serine/threonine protein kinase/pimeloyl-ACP methyl ester carboxylesterase
MSRSSDGGSEFSVGPDADPDRYVLGTAVGSGAEGILYRGSITTSNGVTLDVAIKMLQPRFLSRVEDWHTRWTEQVELLRSLQVPGVVAVRDGFLGPLPHLMGYSGEGKTLYLVMNWVEGQSLDEWIRHRRSDDPVDDLKVLLPVASALDLMHSGRATGGVPVIHRDVKPSNILVADNGTVLVDFGLTRGLPQGQHLSGVVGTPGYLAPESSNEGTYTPASDRYALGAVAHFVITRSEPPIIHQVSVLRDLLTSAPSLRDRPEVIEHILAMLSTDPAKRPTGLANWIGQLRRSSLESGPDLLNPPAPRRHPAEMLVDSPKSRRRGSRRAAIVGMSVTFVVLAGIALFPHGNRSQRAASSHTSSKHTDLGYTPRYKPTPCPSSMAGPGVTCGDLIVPQDRRHPKGRQISLLVTRVSAETAHPAADPVLDVGTPGVGTVSGSTSTARLYSNHITLSIRGGPGSVPELSCPEEEAAAEAALALPPLSSGALAVQSTAMATCRARLIAMGIDPNDYGDDAAAADIRDLLRVMHIRQVNLTASDEGSILAFDVMRQFPQIVRSVSLVDPVPPGSDPDYTAIDNLDSTLRRYVNLCDSMSSCHEAFPDILGQVQRDYVRFQENPVTVSVSIHQGHNPIPVLVDGESGASAVAAAFAGPAITLIASELYVPSPALIATSVATYSIGTGDYVWGAVASFECKDVLPGATRNDRLEEEADVVSSPQLAGVDVGAQLDPRLCRMWNVKPDDPSDFLPIVSPIPTLLYGGALNPYESSAWIPQIAKGLPHSVAVVLPTLDSGSLQTAPSCLTQLRLEFFRHPTRMLSGSSCKAESPPIEFAGT